MSSLADRLHQALARRAALSQAGLARACGVSTATVSNWFSGNIKSIRTPNLRRAADYLGCNRDWLETGNGWPSWTDEQPPNAVAEASVAQYLSQPQPDTAFNPVVQVPVIGTLGLGANMIYVLESPAGKPIGTVPAYSPSQTAYAVRVFGDELYPAVRHGACLVADPDAPPVEGELVLIETTEGAFSVCELVALRAEAVIVTPAVGGQRRTLKRAEVQAIHAITDIVSSSRFTSSEHPQEGQNK